MTAVEIGEEHIRHKKPNDEGFLCVKTCNGKGNKNWTPKQRYVYEKHYGEIPKGHKVILFEKNEKNLKMSLQKFCWGVYYVPVAPDGGGDGLI